MNYVIEFIKKHISKTPDSTKTTQNDHKRRKQDTKTMSTLKKKI